MTLRKTILLVCLLVISRMSYGFDISGCADAGLASATGDSICFEDTITLSLSSYSGTTFQWQGYNGAVWANETGPGATTPTYAVVPGANMQYRAIVGDVGCADDTSNVVIIEVGVMPVPSGTGATRCGAGTVTLQATPPAGLTVNWYDAPTGPGQPLFTGNNFVTPVIANTTTYYASSLSGGVTPILFSEDFEAGTSLPAGWTATGLWHVTSSCTAGSPVDPSNWAYYGNDAQCDFDFPSGVANDGNLTSPMINIPTAAQDAELRFWYIYDGENGTPPTGYDNATVQISQNGGTFNPVLALTGGGAPTLVWTQESINLAPYIGSSIQIRWNFQTIDGVLNNDLGLQVDSIIIGVEGACESPRIPVTATVTPSDSISISAVPPALCLGDSATLTISTANPSYNFAWSPPTGLSGTTGSMVTANPTMPVTYTVLADDGTCGALDSIFIDVGPLSNAGAATVSSDTICQGTNTTLFLNGTVGNIQWQSNTGGGWNNESGQGSDSVQYLVSPAVNTQYQAVVQSGGCPPDTSVTLVVEVINVADPITVNDTICGPGMINLMASAGGLLNWFTTPTGGQPVDTGTVLSTNITGTTTFYVETISGGGSISVGPPTNGFGNQNNGSQAGFGLEFDVIQQITLDRVYVYTQSGGNLTINLRASQAGPIINTVTVPVNAFVAHFPINLGWTITAGSGYRIELGAGSPNLYYNTTGAVYPYTISGSPVTITGFLNPGSATGDDYYYFYDWVVNPGCVSNRVPVTGVVLNPPAVPSITQAGNQLTSSSASNNQWYLNGNPIAGATGQVHVATGPGSYTVVVTDPANGCTSESQPVLITGIQQGGLAGSGISMYPNPAGAWLYLDLERPIDGKVTVFATDGRKVLEQDVVSGNRTLSLDLGGIPAGMYLLRFDEGNNSWAATFSRMAE